MSDSLGRFNSKDSQNSQNSANSDDPLDQMLSDELEALSPLKKASTRWPDPIMNFLIAYDISDDKRLQRIGKYFVACARRVQKSVFVFTGSRKQVEAVLHGAVALIDPAEDRIQCWPIRTSSKACRIDLGTATPDSGVALVVGSDSWTVVEAVDRPEEPDHEPIVPV